MFTCAALAAANAPAIADAKPSKSFIVAFTSDPRFRGVTQTSCAPTGPSVFVVAWDTVYAGAWASVIGSGDGAPGDLPLSRRWPFGLEAGL